MGQCYNRNFWLFSPILVNEIGGFLENQFCDPFLKKVAAF
jgi:hypothetical protein